MISLQALPIPQVPGPPPSGAAPPGAPPGAQPFDSALADHWARTAQAEGQRESSHEGAAAGDARCNEHEHAHGGGRGHARGASVSVAPAALAAASAAVTTAPAVPAEMVAASPSAAPAATQLRSAVVAHPGTGAADGPAADGRAADGRAVYGPVADRPVADGPAADGLTREQASSAAAAGRAASGATTRPKVAAVAPDAERAGPLPPTPLRDAVLRSDTVLAGSQGAESKPAGLPSAAPAPQPATPAKAGATDGASDPRTAAAGERGRELAGNVGSSAPGLRSPKPAPPAEPVLRAGSAHAFPTQVAAVAAAGRARLATTDSGAPRVATRDHSGSLREVGRPGGLAPGADPAEARPSTASATATMARAHLPARASAAGSSPPSPAASTATAASTVHAVGRSVAEHAGSPTSAANAAGSSAAANPGVAESAAAAASDPLAPAPGGPLLAAGVSLQEVIDSVRASIEIAARQGITHARIALQPQELGEIRIHLSQTADGILARVTAATPAAAQALAQGHAELHQSLSSLGLSLLRLDMGQFGGSEARAGGEGGAGRSRGSSSPSSRASRRAQDHTTLDAIERGGEASAATPTDGRLIDVLA